jgi:hypothetical protein
MSQTTKNDQVADTEMKDSAHNPSPEAGRSSRSSRKAQARRAAAALKDEATLIQISWSKQSQPEADLADLIEEGQQMVDGWNSQHEAWKADDSPACSDCTRKHAPPCLTAEEKHLSVVSRKLLAAYKAELEAASKPPAGGEPSNTTTSANGTAKGKERATSAAPAQKDTPASASKSEDGKEEEQSSTKKAAKRKPCARCQTYHSGDCAVPECDRCGAVHWPTQACHLTEVSTRMWAVLFAQCTTEESATAIGKVFNSTFSNPSSGAKDSGKGKKRSADDDPGEGSSSGKKRN